MPTHAPISATGFRSRRIVIRPIRHISRVLPSTLRIKVRPAPEEGKTDGKAPQHAAVNYWRGFCCDHCGRANERTTLAFWKCDPWNWNSNCPGRLEMAETAWSYKDLQPPMRIISTGPRVDEGTPQKFPKETIGVTDVWQDGLKVCKRVIPDQIEIHHALAHATLKTTVDADDLFRRLQSQYRMERVPQKPKVIGGSPAMPRCIPLTSAQRRKTRFGPCTHCSWAKLAKTLKWSTACRLAIRGTKAILRNWNSSR